MENYKKNKMKKMLSVILIVLLLFNVFSPCLSFAAYQQDGQDKYNVLRVSNITKSSSGNYVFYVEYAAIADTYIGSFDMSLSYDTSKFATARKDTGAANTSVARVTETNSDCFTFQTKTVSNGSIRMLGTTTDWWCAADDGESSASFGSELRIFRVYFYLVDPSQWKLDGSKEITSDMISLKPTPSSQTGYKQRIAQDIDGTSPTYITNTKYLATEGFAEKEKSVNSISVKTNPSKTTYEHGDMVNLSGGVLKVTYDDSTTEDISMTDSNVKITNPTTGKADVNNQTITISYKGKTTTLKLNVTDPVKSLAVATPMSKVEYNHGETFDFTGLALKATKKSGATINLTPSSSGVSKSETTANVNSANFTKTSTTGTVPISGIQKITFTYEGKTVTQSVAVNDTISSITLAKQPTKTVYKQGENLDLTGAVVQVTLGSGGKANIDLPDGSVTVSTYNPSTTGSKQHLAIKLGTATASNTIDVEAYNYISNSTLVKPRKTSYKYGEALDLKGGKLDFTWKSGNMTNAVLTSDMVSGYSATKLGTQTVTVKYNAKYTLSDGNTLTDTITKTFTVNVDNEAQSIEITPPSKTQYNYGLKLDLSGGKILVKYTDGTTKNITMTADMITENDGSTVNMSPDETNFVDNKYSKTLKISYKEDEATKTVNYPITIINDIKSITMHTTPTKTKYNVNDALDVTNGEIKIVRAIGNPEIKTITSNMVSGFNSSKENTALPLTVSYTENGITKTTTYNVSVEDQVTAIRINKTPKTKYKYNENLDVSTGQLEITKGSGTTTIPITSNMVTGYDKTKLGDQELTVTYGGKTQKYTVNVKDYVTGISITPNAITGTYNDEIEKLINDNDISYTVTYAKAGAKSPVALAESMVTGYNKTSLTDQNLTLTYTDQDTNSYTNGKTFTTNLSVKLENEISKVTITKPTKTEYNHGEQIDLTGGKITLTYTDGTTKEEPITSATITEKDGGALNMNPTISEYGKDNKVSKTLTLKYTASNGIIGTTSYPITITNTIQSVAIETLPTKVKYNVKETLDTTGGKLKITRATGTTEIIDITKEMISGFDSSKENTKLPLTISYTENGITKTTTFTVSVEDPITSMVMKTTPKTEYKYGEPLDLSTGVITVVRPSGTEEKQITEEMVTGYEPTKIGAQELTITYGGQELKYKVNVKDYITGIILTPPKKVKYEYGEALDLTGGNVQEVMASGVTTSKVALTDSQITISGYNPKQEGAQTINVTYKGQKEQFGVIVENNIQSIIMKTTPKTEYRYGEPLNIAGGTIETIRSNGAKETINITSSMVTGYNPNKIGKQKITVTYKDKTTSYEVDVKDYIEDIDIVKPNKLVYKIGEKIDLTDGKVKPIMASKTATTPVAMTNPEVQIEGFDTSTEGAKTIKVTYKGYTKTFGITVIDQTSSMTIKTLPNKLEYKYGESLDLAGGTLEFKKGNETQIINITQDMITGYNSKEIGNQTLTVTYQGLTQEFIVNVKDYIAKLEIEKPKKIDYEYGENLDLTGGKLSIITASGKVDEKIDITLAMVSGYDKIKEGIQTITVEYKGLQGEFQVSVKDKIKAIALNNEPNKINYKNGEAIDITGATINIVKSSGIKTIPVTYDMISGYNPQNSGLQVVTVTYEGFKTKFLVSVAEKEKQEQKQEEIKQEDSKAVIMNKTVIINNNIKEDKQEQLPEEKVETPINEDKNQNLNTDSTKEKERVTPEVKDEKINRNKQIAAAIGIAGLILLLLLLFFKRNVKIYVEENGEFVLGGIDKLTKKHPELNIDEYLDGETYPNKVKIHLSDKISEKLDGKEIKIKHRGKIIKIKVVYEDKPYEIILK